ncbi:hypothetical protein Vadar_034267 [Vaccinium darrowii]|uniref:Uncharacterized protein n=1 Tax=Vaccinium darrowii TaxID=229202 RepID=A0ACB7YAK6_9ERIC|nr:hypothetical protein Vadar_034267 [Vaccinium darrowii]
MMLKFFNVLAWPSFTLLCPLYASIRAIESNSQSNFQACLTCWVSYIAITMLETMLSKLLAWLPFWPYAKGIAILVLVVPYFRGATYVYLHFIRPYIYENSQIHGFLLIPKAEVSTLNEENCLPDAAESYNRVKREDELEKFVIYEVESKSSHDNIETDLKNGQKDWSCAVCPISTSSKKCLEKHFQGKKHRAMEEEQRRNEAIESKRVSFPCKMKTTDRMAPLNNVNPNTWVNLANLSSLLNPIARSIGWCTWKSPEFGWTKLNTDGSVHPENARFGGLLRGYKGDPICAYVSKSSVDDSFLVELWAIWRGLVLALGLGITVIWVESDAMGVVKMINKEQPYTTRASSCLKDIWSLLRKFEKYKVSHVWRESNRAADYLAKMDLVGSDVVIWPGDFPERLRSIIDDDAQGTWYRRGLKYF